MPPDFTPRLERRMKVRNAEIASLQVIFFFVLPISLLYFKIIPITANVYVLLIFSMLIYGVIKKEGWTEKDLGITTVGIKKAIPVYLVSTIVAFATIILLAHKLHMPPTHHWWNKPHFLFLFIVVSFFQEFAFRGFLMPLLHRIFPDTFTIILVNSLLFAGMHAIYPSQAIGLPFAFVGGLFFALLYRKYPNLILISISHSILNFIAVWYGFFTIKP